jgi:hypothetical protein
MFKERDFVCFDHGSDFRHERRVRVLLALFRDRLSHRMSGVDDHRVRFLDAKLIDAGDPINQCGSIDLVKGYEVRAAHFSRDSIAFLARWPHERRTNTPRVRGLSWSSRSAPSINKVSFKVGSRYAVNNLQCAYRPPCMHIVKAWN